ncbi:glycosyltransferase family 39 protein [Sulfurimonas sp. MAG313]|nr:glycosyltransferase family 39 protein [Sulfurimonas sp. MAG313]MDF1879930.1 glycosyltransferase family 39 protein [Sulfurimonas sp. MAG313]
MPSSNAYRITILIAVHTCILFLFISELSINFYEAKTYFNETSLLHYIINFSTFLFGQNDIALRIPMILMHFIGAFLYYDISKDMFKKQSDKLWNLFIYLLLPGINSVGIMVDGAGLVLFLLLIFLYLYKHQRTFAYILLPLYVFIDASFAFMYLSFIFFAIDRRKTYLLLASVLLFGASMYLFGIEIGGYPKNFFISTLGIYAAIFSPIVFVYLIYSLYRWGVKEERTLLWYLGVTAFLFSMLLSFRQQMKLEELAPYIIISTPIMVKTFLSSYRIRLREFRRGYRILLLIGISVLIISTLSIFMNKFIYLFIKDPTQHFVYKNHVAKELSKELKKLGIYEVVSTNKNLQLQLKFYGITKAYTYNLEDTKPSSESKSVTIRYINVEIAKFYVTKLYK